MEEEQDPMKHDRNILQWCIIFIFFFLFLSHINIIKKLLEFNKTFLYKHRAAIFPTVILMVFPIQYFFLVQGKM